MAQVTIQVNGRPYTVGCEDGQEPHLTELARLFDRQVRQVSQDVGHVVRSALRVLRAKSDGVGIVPAQERIRIEIVVRENLS